MADAERGSRAVARDGGIEQVEQGPGHRDLERDGRRILRRDERVSRVVRGLIRSFDPPPPLG